MRNEQILAKRGVCGVYVRVTKATARKMFNAGYYVNILGNKQRREQDNFIPIDNLSNNLSFDKLINTYCYYNELYYGYPIYFVDSYDYRKFTV